VEAILSHHEFGLNSERYFLVKWKGYDHPTWEPERNLTNCDGLKARYEAQIVSSPIEEQEDFMPLSAELPSSLDTFNMLMATTSEEDDVIRQLSPISFSSQETIVLSLERMDSSLDR
jgi:hypothetical protein